MQIGKIYKTNILFAVIYFITVLLSTLLVSLLGEINLNNLMLRTVLCFFFSILMLFISIENYKNGKQFVNKKIKSKIVKVAIVFYYLYIFASCILYIYESIAQYKANADTMRFGPLRPVGLVNPNTGHRPWANVQLRAENKERTLYNIVGFQTNLKWGEQKRVFSMIPGLENAEFVRYGVMHRNTFLDAPRVLSAQLCLKEHPNVFFAGQITGFEGYMESAACGLLAARSLYARLEGKELPAPPVDTMCGALVQYLTTENKHFQPMGANMGILPPLPEESRPRDKRLRYMAQAQRAVASFQHWLDETSL